MWAAIKGRADCARLLIDAGADKDATALVRVGRCFAEALPRDIAPCLCCICHMVLLRFNQRLAPFHVPFSLLSSK